jgi:hypothetical protein
MNFRRLRHPMGKYGEVPGRKDRYLRKRTPYENWALGYIIKTLDRKRLHVAPVHNTEHTLSKTVLLVSLFVSMFTRISCAPQTCRRHS